MIIIRSSVGGGSPPCRWPEADFFNPGGRAEEAKKSTMATHLIPNPLKDREPEDQSGAPPRDASPSIKGLKNREIQAKASDFTQDLA